MSRNTLIGFVVFVIIIVGAVFLFGSKTASQPTAATSTATSTSEVSGGSLQEQLSGTWQSNDDAKFTRTITATTVTDAYAGDASATETGNYSIVNPAVEPNFPVPAEIVAGMSVLRVDFPKTGTMYFSIQTLSTSTLEMTYLSGRGNILSFTRVK